MGTVQTRSYSSSRSKRAMREEDAHRDSRLVLSSGLLGARRFRERSCAFGVSALPAGERGSRLGVDSALALSGIALGEPFRMCSISFCKASALELLLVSWFKISILGCTNSNPIPSVELSKLRHLCRSNGAKWFRTARFHPAKYWGTERGMWARMACKPFGVNIYGCLGGNQLNFRSGRNHYCTQSWPPPHFSFP
jgi:hypothetical protein